MAKVSFKVKPVKEIYMDGEDPNRSIIYFPKLKRAHCDMNAFRQHKKFGGFANSDMFEAMLQRVAKAIAPHGWIKTDNIPEGVTVDQSGFLWKVTLDL